MAIFVKGFDFDTPESAIIEHFEQIGPVSGVELVGRGAAVVRYEDSSHGWQAVQDMNETTIPGNRRYVNVKMDGDKGKGKGGKKGGGGKGYGDRGPGKGSGDRTTYDGEYQEGTVARFFTDRGFGYISPDTDDGDIFVHFSAIQGSGFRELTEGQRVSFGVEPDPKGRQKGQTRAVAVSVID
mmetsp:Transcript_128376/g.256414  ORF Transcript_128376/g.256414 Transcript_128376/m.256414 type:complete len:182 (+) Transcript_128376:72-617(+)|eukprot:CAMPEP_0172727398 /NCGR_PEP_ID=MMETSP1074-20121228/91657_1 /TAXON_ID=2916 /ORGANISM="Ceratium fusus, Strain PA161109" /LENGTH=181 /DNA_ID=CAMNT_0013554545 /DNA_START=66 /DNA_END=611 /DNA_ORIENTATION=-